MVNRKCQSELKNYIEDKSDSPINGSSAMTATSSIFKQSRRSYYDPPPALIYTNLKPNVIKMDGLHIVRLPGLNIPASPSRCKVELQDFSSMATSFL